MEKVGLFRILNFHYPATELLDESATPHLDPPKYMEYREKPHVGDFHFAPSQLAFSVRFPVRSAGAALNTSLMVDELSMHIGRLTGSAGISTLFAVSYEVADDIMTRFRLQTNWLKQTSSNVEQYDFELASGQLDMLLVSAQGDDWVAILRGLMASTSDRALLSRWMNLKAGARRFEDLSESSRDWETLFPTPALPLQHKINYVDNFYGFCPPRSLIPWPEARPDDEMLQIPLPCGHIWGVQVAFLKAVSFSDFLDAHCEDCRHPALDRDGRINLKLALSTNRRVYWSIDQICWERLDGHIIDGTTRVKITAVHLMNSLVLARGSMHVPQARLTMNRIGAHELLNFHYSTIELLEPGQELRLEPPKDHLYREEPKLGSYHLQPESLNSFFRLPIRAHHTAEHGMTDGDLVGEVERLSTAPGKSNLFLVSFTNGDDIVTRARLDTIWLGGDEATLERQEFQLSWIEMKLLLLAGGTNDWVAMLRDLIRGTTDRAVLHAQRNLQSVTPGTIYPQLSWDSLSLPSPSDLLLSKLLAKDEKSMAFSPIGSVAALAGYTQDDLLDIQFPCGHQSTVWVGNLLETTAHEQVLQAVCTYGDCRRPILGKTEKNLLKLAKDRQYRLVWTLHELEWKDYDAEIKDNDYTRNITAGKLLSSLKLAVPSLSAPSSTTPRRMNATVFPETKAIMCYLQNMLQPTDKPINLTPVGLLKELQAMAFEALRQATPWAGDRKVLTTMLLPGYGDFVLRWLTRSINHATELAIGHIKKDENVEKLLGSMIKLGLDGKGRREEDEAHEQQNPEQQLERLMGKMGMVDLNHDDADEQEEDEVL